MQFYRKKSMPYSADIPIFYDNFIPGKSIDIQAVSAAMEAIGAALYEFDFSVLEQADTTAAQLRNSLNKIVQDLSILPQLTPEFIVQATTPESTKQIDATSKQLLVAVWTLFHLTTAHEKVSQQLDGHHTAGIDTEKRRLQQEIRTIEEQMFEIAGILVGYYPVLKGILHVWIQQCDSDQNEWVRKHGPDAITNFSGVYDCAGELVHIRQTHTSIATRKDSPLSNTAWHCLLFIRECLQYVSHVQDDGHFESLQPATYTAHIRPKMIAELERLRPEAEADIMDEPLVDTLFTIVSLAENIEALWEKKATINVLSRVKLRWKIRAMLKTSQVVYANLQVFTDYVDRLTNELNQDPTAESHTLAANLKTQAQEIIDALDRTTEYSIEELAKNLQVIFDQSRVINEFLDSVYQVDSTLG